MQYKVGYLDDEYDYVSNIDRNLKKCGLNMLSMQEIESVANLDSLINFIIDNEIGCLLVDYDLLKLKSKIYGTQVIKEINDILPSFPCFLLTNYVGAGKLENIVQAIFVEDKEIFLEDYDSDKFQLFIKRIKNGIDCFYKRLEISISEYKTLFDKMKNDQIIPEEEYKFHSLYRVLKSYHFVDEIPDFFLYKKTQDNFNEMLGILKDIDKKLEK
jgi:hypothetical protein